MSQVKLSGKSLVIQIDSEHIRIAQTVLGTARLIDETELSVAEARETVCSPGGTTLAALDAMNAAGFAQVFEAGVKAAVVRSKELAQS